MGPMIYHHLVLISATTIFLHIRDSLARNFLQVGPTITTFLGTGSFNRIFSTKTEYLGKLILKSQTATFTKKKKKRRKISTIHTHVSRIMRAWRTIIDTYFNDTFFTSSIQMSPTVLWA